MTTNFLKDNMTIPFERVVSFRVRQIVVENCAFFVVLDGLKQLCNRRQVCFASRKLSRCLSFCFIPSLLHEFGIHIFWLSPNLHQRTILIVCIWVASLQSVFVALLTSSMNCMRVRHVLWPIHQNKTQSGHYLPSRKKSHGTEQFRCCPIQWGIFGFLIEVGWSLGKLLSVGCWDYRIQ